MAARKVCRAALLRSVGRTFHCRSKAANDFRSAGVIVLISVGRILLVSQGLGWGSESMRLSRASRMAAEVLEAVM